MLRFREAQMQALEEMEEKHQAMTEEAQQEKEEEKQLLVTVLKSIILKGPLSWQVNRI